MVVVDTNIVIDHLRLQGRADSKLMHLARTYSKQTLAISMLTVQELYQGRSTANQQKEQFMLATISPLKILPYTYEIAQLAGEIVRDRKQPITLADAAIAATAVLHGGQLATVNRKDFATIDGLQLLPINE